MGGVIVDDTEKDEQILIDIYNTIINNDKTNIYIKHNNYIYPAVYHIDSDKKIFLYGIAITKLNTNLADDNYCNIKGMYISLTKNGVIHSGVHTYNLITQDNIVNEIIDSDFNICSSKIIKSLEQRIINLENSINENN